LEFYHPKIDWKKKNLRKLSQGQGEKVVNMRQKVKSRKKTYVNTCLRFLQEAKKTPFAIYAAPTQKYDKPTTNLPNKFEDFSHVFGWYNTRSSTVWLCYWSSRWNSTTFWTNLQFIGEW
jgi:hypothetical protein